MKNVIHTITLIIVFSCFLTNSFGRDNNYTDSLINLAQSNKRISNSDLYQLYIQIAERSTNASEIFTFSTKALQLAKDHPDLGKSTASPLVYIGYSYMLKGDLSKALNYYLEAAEIQVREKDSIGLAGTYNYIAQAYRIQNHHVNAIAYYKKAIEIIEAEQDTTRLASFFLNIGYEYYKQNVLDTALMYYKKSGALFKAINNEVGLAYNLGNIGLLYTKQDSLQLAESNFKEAILTLQKFHDNYAITEFQIEMAKIYQKKGDIDKAIFYALESYATANENLIKEHIRDASLVLSELYNLKGNYEKAFDYQSQYLVNRDNINNEATIRKMADLRTEYEIEQKQTEIDLLTERAQKNKVLAASLMVVLFLLGVLAYVFYRNYKRKKFINRKLLKQKEILKVHRDELQNLNQTKDRFFSIISHDLRGPVNAFNGISNLIKHYISQNDMVQLVEVTEYIDKSARQLSTLLDNLLDWAINQQGTFPHNPTKIDLNAIVEEIVEIFQTTAHAKGIILKINIQSDICLWADKNSMTTILRNLVNNSLKFTNTGGTVTIRAVQNDKWANIEVVDTGIGIPDKKLKSIFELMEKKNTHGTAGEKGLGLGLQLAYDFTAMNKGSIAVKSSEGVGTTFILKVPLYEKDFHNSEQGDKKFEIYST